MTCAAALANIEFLTDETFQKKLEKRSRLFERLCHQLEKFDSVVKVYCRGMVAGIILDNIEPNDFQVYAANVNGDTEIDILDIVYMVDIILNN